MKTEREKLIKKVREFLVESSRNAVEETKTQNGASSTFFLNIDINISVVLAWTDGFDHEEDDPFSDGTWRLEASVRLRDSSYFVEDWDYINEGCFCAIYPGDEEEGFEGIATWLVDMMLDCGYLHPKLIVPIAGHDWDIFFYADDVEMEYRHYVPDERGLVQEWWYYHGWNRDSESAKRLKIWSEYVAEWLMAYAFCDDEDISVDSEQIFQALIKED